MNENTKRYMETLRERLLQDRVAWLMAREIGTPRGIPDDRKIHPVILARVPGLVI